jgi:hypothetical protein
MIVVQADFESDKYFTRDSKIVFGLSRQDVDAFLKQHLRKVHKKNGIDWHINSLRPICNVDMITPLLKRKVYEEATGTTEGFVDNENSQEDNTYMKKSYNITAEQAKEIAEKAKQDQTSESEIVRRILRVGGGN